MANSLADQLLKAGMVDKQKVRKVQAEKRKQERQRRHNKIEVKDEAAELAAKAAAKKQARDRELNRQRKAKAEQQAKMAQVKQLIEANRIDYQPGETAWNFSEGGKVRQLYLPEKLRAQVLSGAVAVVSATQGYELVPLTIAERIAERLPDRIVYHADATEDAEIDEDYAGYEIPDDLTW